MSAQPQHRLTPEEYLEIERAAEFRSEYYDGHMYAMADGSREHNLVVLNLARELGNRLMGRPCSVYAIDLRLRISHEGLYTYPDLMVVCGDAKLIDKRNDTITNPSLVVEVLSPSTEKDDRRFKLEQYQKIDSAQEYALVSQFKPLVEIYRRDPNGNWNLWESRGFDTTCRFESVDCEIPMSEIYYQVSFQESQEL